MLVEYFNVVRFWLIRKLAGKTLVAINLKLTSTLNLTNAPALVSDCEFEGPLNGDGPAIRVKEDMSDPRFTKKELETIRPLDVTGYLRAKGWNLEHIITGHSVGYSAKLNEDETEYLTIPLNKHFADYALRMSEVIDILARYEVRSSQSVCRDLLGSAIHVKEA